jgi:hypothetical protein
VDLRDLRVRQPRRQQAVRVLRAVVTMAFLSRTPPPNPTRTTWTVEMTGTCGGGHKCSTTTQVNAVNGSMGAVTASGQCGTCNSDVNLTGHTG